MTDWISVEDRLPDPLHRDVIMYISSEREIVIGWKGAGRGWMSQMFEDEFYGGRGGYGDDEVSHWMPLPDPPVVTND